MKKKILFTFRIPDEVFSMSGDDVDIMHLQQSPFARDELLSSISGVDAVIVGSEPIDRPVIDAGVNLKVIGRHGVGCDAVDYIYAGKKGIAVVNTPHSVTHPTAELTIGLLIDVARQISWQDRNTRRTGRCVPPATPYDTSSAPVYGKTLGIIGFGRIGKAVAVKAHGLGMKILYSAPREVTDAGEARKVSMEDLLKTSDYVTLHCSYTPKNHHLISGKTLALMKPSAYLINASRGKTVDEAALTKALREGVIKGAALDVYEFEPEINRELLGMDNVVLVPHIGTLSYDARIEMTKEVLDGVCAVLRNETPPNLFNGEWLTV
jgi:lactate dehydrogenase-like 2-hydroxyacid dehydrogenase